MKTYEMYGEMIEVYKFGNFEPSDKILPENATDIKHSNNEWELRPPWCSTN